MQGRRGGRCCSRSRHRLDLSMRAVTERHVLGVRAAADVKVLRPAGWGRVGERRRFMKARGERETRLAASCRSHSVPSALEIGLGFIVVPCALLCSLCAPSQKGYVALCEGSAQGSAVARGTRASERRGGKSGRREKALAVVAQAHQAARAHILGLAGRKGDLERPLRHANELARLLGDLAWAVSRPVLICARCARVSLLMETPARTR